MTTRLYLVRHGEVAAEWHQKLYGCLNVPLSDLGMLEAREVAKRVPSEAGAAPRVVVSSGLARAVYGAEQIAQPRQLEHRICPDLRELDRGDWAGRELTELKASVADWFQDPEQRRPPNGESLGDLRGRVLPSLQLLADEYSGSAVCIVAHLWVLRVATCQALDLPLNACLRLDLPTGALVVIDWPVGGTSRAKRPTLAGFGTDEPPTGRGWFRGPHRSGRP